MPDAAAREVVAKAYVKESIPRRPVSEIDKQASQLEATVQEQGWRQALEVSREPRVERGKISGKLEQIGTERGDDGQKQRTPEEETRYQHATAYKDVIGKFLEKGYDTPEASGGLTRADRVHIQTQVIREIMSRPDLARKYNSLDNRGKWQFIERHIRNPKFAAKLREKLATIADSPEIPDTVTDKQDQVREQEIERDRVQEEINEISQRLNAVDARLKEFKRPTRGGRTIGAKAQELDRLRNDFTQMQTELRTNTQTHANANHRLQLLDQERRATFARPGAPGLRTIAEIDGDITNERNNLNTAQQEIDRLTASIDRIPQLEQEEQSLQEQKREISSEHRTKHTELDRVIFELGKRQREFQDAKSVRASAEQDVVDGLRDIWGESANELINEDLNALAEQVNTQLEEAKTNARDTSVKAALGQLEKELSTTITRKRWGKTETRRVINKSNTKNLVDGLITHGPEYVMKVLMLRTINPSTGRMFTVPEIEARMKDQSFVDELKPQVITQALSRDILIEGLTEDKIYAITNSQWGAGMIEQAMQKNEEFRNAVEDVMGQGELEKPGFTKRFAKELGNDRNLWLLLLGVLGLPVIAGISAAGAVRGNKLYA